MIQTLTSRCVIWWLRVEYRQDSREYSPHVGLSHNPFAAEIGIQLRGMQRTMVVKPTIAYSVCTGTIAVLLILRFSVMEGNKNGGMQNPTAGKTMDNQDKRI